MKEMLEDDYKLSLCGILNSKISVSNDKFLGEFIELDDALDCIKDDMEKNQYWPNIWVISDHGNVWQIDLEGMEICQDE